MASREERIKIFEHTYTLCREDAALRDSILHSVQSEQIYWKNDPINGTRPRYSQKAKILLESKRTVEAAESYAKAGKKVAILNFASYVNPGGGVLKGSSAQEESICRVSTLYPALSNQCVSDFYLRHRKQISEEAITWQNSDDCIYTPGIVAIRKDDHDCNILPAESRYSFDVITCAAPDLRHHGFEDMYIPSEEELYNCYEIRIRRILEIAALHAVDVLVLGAFGCGAFGNDPEIVSKAFYSAIQKDFNYAKFETLLFAIPFRADNPYNYTAFTKIPEIEKDIDLSLYVL